MTVRRADCRQLSAPYFSIVSFLGGGVGDREGMGAEPLNNGAFTSVTVYGGLQFSSWASPTSSYMAILTNLCIW